MKCPFCGSTENKVVDSRDSETGEAIRRRRECLSCAKRFTTYERIESLPLFVVKKDGRREEFSHRKLLDGLLVAAKKEKIADYTGVISQAGRVPIIVDVDAFALQNAYEMNYSVSEGKVLALVNVGASVTNVNVLSGSTSMFWRDITFGGNQYTDAIQREMSLSFEQAEDLKKGQAVGDRTVQQVIPILNSVSEDFSGELRKTLDFFTATSGADRVDEIVLAGGGSGVLNLDATLRDKFGIPVTIMDPFKKVTVDEKVFNPEQLADLGPSMAIAVGLAMRKLGDA